MLKHKIAEVEPETFWMGVSRFGHLAPFAGIGVTRKHLVAEFEKQHGVSLKDGGYRPIRVRVTPC
jgi:hypothetical protein